jgi:uncharacterized protein (DUF2147 family)
MKRTLLTLIPVFTWIAIHAQTHADDILGIWLTQGKDPAKIQIFKTGDHYFGKIVWLQFPLRDGKPKTDQHNPDKDKQSRPVIGLEILHQFKFDGTDEWKDGEVYDPESGKTYSCTISFKDKNTLKVRGYVGISLLGRTENWIKSSL